MLQILQWYRPRERWVLKSPQHLEQIGPLLTTFPDATIVVTHRDPVAVVQSTATMVCYGARTTYRTHPARVVPRLLDRPDRPPARRVAARPRTCCPSTARSTCSSTSTWPTRWAPSQRVYDCAGIELTDGARAEIEAYRAAHPRGKEGRVVYDLRRDFAITPEEVRARFGVYLDRFAVRIEVR